MLRAFFAIEPPQQMQKSIANMIEQLKISNKVAIQWIKPQNLHITLQFINNVQLNDIPVLIKNVTHEVRSIPPFELELNHLELFPDLEHPRLISIALTSDVILTDIAKRIGAGIIASGYPVESRSYHAHMTLGRFKDTQIDYISLKNIALPQEKKFSVNQIIFYQSNLSNKGSYYTILEIIALIDF